MPLSLEATNSWLKIVKFMSRFAAIASVIAGALIKVSPSSVGLEVDVGTDQTVQKYAQIAFPMLLIMAPCLEWARRRLERKTLWPIVKEILEDFRKQIYPGSKDPAHFHKVTLFKRCKWVARRQFFSRFFAFGWLKIIERTGHVSQNSRTVFFAPNDPDKAEGVAGLAWAWNTLVYKEGLPDLKTNGVSAEKIAEYAAASNARVEDIAKIKPSSRSLCGFPIEVKGVVWGVLVVDSRNPELPKQLIEQHYALSAKFLSRILERL